MLILPIDEARPGMRLAVTVYHPSHAEQELLKAGFKLDDRTLAKMRDLGVRSIYVEYPDLSDLDRHLLPYLSPVRREIYSQVRRTMESVQRSSKPVVSFNDYYANTRLLVLTLLQQGQHPLYMEELSGSLGADAVRHATSVAHLALVLGLRLEHYLVKQRNVPPQQAKEVVNIGVAGMLHDIGKSRIPAHLQQYSCVDQIEDPMRREAWEQHATQGYEMVRGGVEPSAAAAVLHHHQHFDGTGFPARPTLRDEKTGQFQGEKTHVFARILLAADVYQRLAVTAKGQRRINLEILTLMRTRYASRIDPEILRIFPSVVPPFPPASKVQLSDGTSAVVMSFQLYDPYRPTLRRLDKDGWTLIGEPFSVADAGAPTITSVCGTSVSGQSIPTAPEPVPAMA